MRRYLNLRFSLKQTVVAIPEGVATVTPKGADPTAGRLGRARGPGLRAAALRGPASPRGGSLTGVLAESWESSFPPAENHLFKKTLSFQRASLLRKPPGWRGKSAHPLGRRK